MGLDKINFKSQGAVYDKVFGEDSRGETPEERASTSIKVFVRSQIQLAFDNPRAKGRRLSAIEALNIFGWDILAGLADDDVVATVIYRDEPGKTIKERRIELGLSDTKVASSIKLDIESIRSLESNKKTIPIRHLEEIARLLSLNEDQLGLQQNSGADQYLGVRLRTLLGSQNEAPTNMSSSLVLGLSEAAWVIKRQLDLMRADLESPIIGPRKNGFVPNGNYAYPAWRQGLHLAHLTRELLGIGPHDPIANMKELVEHTLSIPVIQADLPGSFAGATIANGGRSRGIVLNLCGANSNVWVRRNTLAHELCHLLWDPTERLNQLRVDNFGDLDKDPFLGVSSSRDVVEIRANAFAAEFLAPQSAIMKLFVDCGSSSLTIQNVMNRYGISFTSAYWQAANSIGGTFDRSEMHNIDSQPTDDWVARESYTTDYFPLKNTPISRRGRFSRALIDAMEQGRISSDTVASCLNSTTEEVVAYAPVIKDLFN